VRPVLRFGGSVLSKPKPRSETAVMTVEADWRLSAQQSGYNNLTRDCSGSRGDGFHLLLDLVWHRVYSVSHQCILSPYHWLENGAGNDDRTSSRCPGDGHLGT